MTIEWAREDPRDLTARVEAAEAALRELQARQTVEVEAKLALPAPPQRTQFSSAAAEASERARVARVLAWQDQVEAERQQTIKDAPKRAKRDKALAAIDEQMSAARAEIAGQEEKLCRLAADRVKLARRPL